MNITQLLNFLFVFNAFLFQIILITHFSLRKWRFDAAMRYGWVVYAFQPAFSRAKLLMMQND